MIAVANSHFETVKLLLQQPGIVVDLCDDLRQTPLHHANANDCQNVAKLLLEANATITASTDSATSRIEILKVIFFCLPLFVFSFNFFRVL